MRAALGLIGFGLALSSAGSALLLHGEGVDTAGCWMLAAAGLGACAVAAWPARTRIALRRRA